MSERSLILNECSVFVKTKPSAGHLRSGVGRDAELQMSAVADLAQQARYVVGTPAGE
jgi:hypothetical protein